MTFHSFPLFQDPLEAAEPLPALPGRAGDGAGADEDGAPAAAVRERRGRGGGLGSGLVPQLGLVDVVVDVVRAEDGGAGEGGRAPHIPVGPGITERLSNDTG